MTIAELQLSCKIRTLIAKQSTEKLKITLDKYRTTAEKASCRVDEDIFINRAHAQMDVEDDVNDYEVPHDDGTYEDVCNDFEDVASGQLYANNDNVMPQGSSNQIQRGRIGYVTMENKPTVVDFQVE